MVEIPTEVFMLSHC